jgi:hypothetical protein
MASAALPVTPSKDHLFALQTVSAGYESTLRAVATAVLFRFARVNCGHGAVPGSYEPVATDEVLTTEAALKSRFLPAHLVQVLLAEWLAVYAGLQSKSSEPIGSFMELVDIDGVDGVVNSPRDVLTNKDDVQGRVKHGRTLLSPAAVLVFAIDWYGLAYPVISGRQDPVIMKTWHVLRNKLYQLRPSGCAASSLVGASLRAGLGLSPVALIQHLNTVFTQHEVANPHPVRLVLATLIGPAAPYNLQDMYAATRAFSHSGDYSNKQYKASESVSVPQTVQFPSAAHLDKAISDCGWVVLATDTHTGHVHALLHTETDAPLQYLAVDASIAAIVKCLPAMYEESFQNDVVAQTWRLYPTYTKADIAASVKRSMHMRFGGAPVVGQQLASAPVPADVSSTLTGAIEHPKMLRPGRWFTPGPPMVALYYAPSVWYFNPVKSWVHTLLQFFKRVQVVRAAKTTHRPPTYLIQDGVAKYEIVTASKSTGAARRAKGYGLVDVSGSAVNISACKDITGVPLCGVVFSKENLLWLAAVQDDRAREVVAELWSKHHVPTATARRFDDTQSSKLISDAVCAKLEDAGQWPGVAADMVFYADDITATALLIELDEMMYNQPVVRSGGAYYYGTVGLGKDVVVTHEFVGDGKGYVLTTLAEPLTVPDKIIDLRTQYLNRALLITTTQLSLVYAVGSENEVRALQSMASFGLDAQLPVPALRPLAEVDYNEVAKRVGYAFNDDASLLSSAATLS